VGFINPHAGIKETSLNAQYLCAHYGTIEQLGEKAIRREIRRKGIFKG
jgi:hypothetical protein